MNTFQLVDLQVVQHGVATKVKFTKGELVVIADSGFVQWYVDLEGVTDQVWLQHFYDSTDLKVELQANTRGGKVFAGIGYIHVNVSHQAAVIRGDDVLHGM